MLHVLFSECWLLLHRTIPHRGVKPYLWTMCTKCFSNQACVLRYASQIHLGKVPLSHLWQEVLLCPWVFSSTEELITVEMPYK